MLEGDLDRGELEIGQICSLIKNLPTTQEMVEQLVKDYHEVIQDLQEFQFQV